MDTEQMLTREDIADLRLCFTQQCDTLKRMWDRLDGIQQRLDERDKRWSDVWWGIARSIIRWGMAIGLGAAGWAVKNMASHHDG